MQNYIFWSEEGSGFGEPRGTPPPRIPRGTPLRIIALLQIICPRHCATMTANFVEISYALEPA